MGKQIINGDVEITGQLLKGDLKSLYHLGAYDSVDTSNADYDVITKHIYITDKSAIQLSNSVQGLTRWSVQNLPAVLKTASDNDVYTANYIKFIVDGVEMSLVSATDVYGAGTYNLYCVSAAGNINFTYNGTPQVITIVFGEYTYKVAKNQPTSLLDQNGENWLRGEYEKTTNLLHGTFTNGQAYSGNGNTYSDGNAKCIPLKIEPNTTYALNNGGYIWVNEYNSAGTFLRQKSAPGTFTTSSDCAYVGLTYPIAVNAMLNYGSTALPYQPYNGKVMHAIDVEGVKLWENGNPSNPFLPSDIDIPTLQNYKRFKIAYKYFSGWRLVSYSEFDVAPSGSIGDFSTTLMGANRNTGTPEVSSRRITISGNSISFAHAYYNENAQLDDLLIPIAIYGIK